jgi:hypothetical protein
MVITSGTAWVIPVRRPLGNWSARSSTSRSSRPAGDGPRKGERTQLSLDVEAARSDQTQQGGRTPSCWGWPGGRYKNWPTAPG